MTDLLAQLTEILGVDGVLTGESVRTRSAGVWKADSVEAAAILRPRSTSEISQVLKICHSAGQAIVAHGGLTGLVEGAWTRPDELVLSLERMRKIEELDEVGRTMTVQAGAPLQTIQDAAETAGLMFPLDLGARGSCTIGGNVATNAGGNRVIRYGMTRDMVLGLEAVLADGTVLSSLNKMIKNNAGYDLKQLFIGTEGTLGIVTRVVLRLREQWRSQNTAFVAIDHFEGVTAFLKQIDASLGGTLSAFEVMWEDFYQLVTTAPATGKPPLDYGRPYYVLVEALGADQEADTQRFEAALGDALQEQLIVDAVIAKSDAERGAMWAMRDDVEQAFQYAPLFIFDVSLSLRHMPDYVPEVTVALAAAWPEHRCFVFGHLGDGNLHFVVSVGDGSAEARQRVEQIIYTPLSDIGGSISAEHGIGLEKKAYLPVSRAPEEIAMMRRLKQALDPNGILNPGKVFDPV